MKWNRLALLHQIPESSTDGRQAKYSSWRKDRTMPSRKRCLHGDAPLSGRELAARSVSFVVGLLLFVEDVRERIFHSDGTLS